jgi:hypothetical protein
MRDRRSTTQRISSGNKQIAKQEHIPSVSDRTTMSLRSAYDVVRPQERTSVTDLVTNKSTMSICPVEEDVERPQEQTSSTHSVTNATYYTSRVILPIATREYNLVERASTCFC